MTLRSVTIAVLLFVSQLAAAEKDLTRELEQATAELSTDTYQLRYKFSEGETIRYRVEHLATVDALIAGTSQETKSRSASTKVWNVTHVDDSRIQLVHSVEDVDMWQKVGDRDDVRYNSRTDDEPPAAYAHVAESLGKPLAEVSINTAGRILTRENKANHPGLGFGGLVLPLPEKPVRVGDTWIESDAVKVREPDGRLKEIKTRLRYRLEKVQTGMATISVRTQVLTPLNDARLKSQLIQQLSHGEIRFDIDAGRVVSRQLDWDENVVGFNGPDSNMKYLARFTEKLEQPKPNATQAASPRQKR